MAKVVVLYYGLSLLLQFETASDDGRHSEIEESLPPPIIHNEYTPAYMYEVVRVNASSVW